MVICKSAFVYVSAHILLLRLLMYFKDVVKPFVGLDPTEHCAGISRYDKETVIVAVANTYDCAF